MDREIPKEIRQKKNVTRRSFVIHPSGWQSIVVIGVLISVLGLRAKRSCLSTVDTGVIEVKSQCFRQGGSLHLKK